MDRTDVPAPFNATHADAYAEGPPRQVPGFSSLHRMTGMLLAERVPSNGRVLVLGAGGGLELKALTDDFPDWTFDGVDPSADMLRVAAQAVGEHRGRVRLHEGYIDVAPKGPFNGAVCLLTLHFVPHDNRLDTLREIHRRLVPGAPFVVAHISFPQTEPERSLWITRHLKFGGTDPANAERAKRAISERLTILSPAEDESMLGEAGFSNVSLFYAGLSFRGWVGYA
ncbi:class I SAM-dependent methyltransferase [Devosia rhodophyticola]|uniref:Class I SAM-dependent methyltransferase n=1 Tax=Devosia rhodophyticola TaxID=3026423 RepID=A0ABY7Z0E3_9HYPH|nr:class I SAM-dependent methyltransferase [Devosia rhodophyticola]WDR06495.1 class I SAM-dependent methyltransferase [Devosia rhodophyticola]